MENTIASPSLVTAATPTTSNNDAVNSSASVNEGDDLPLEENEKLEEFKQLVGDLVLKVMRKDGLLIKDRRKLLNRLATVCFHNFPVETREKKQLTTKTTTTGTVRTVAKAVIKTTVVCERCGLVVLRERLKNGVCSSVYKTKRNAALPNIRLEPGNHACVRGEDDKRYRCEFCKYLKHKGLIPKDAFIRKALFKCAKCNIYLCKTKRNGNPSCFELFHSKHPLQDLNPNQYKCKTRGPRKRKVESVASPQQSQVTSSVTSMLSATTSPLPDTISLDSASTVAPAITLQEAVSQTSTGETQIMF
eukprot:g2823.t1